MEITETEALFSILEKHGVEEVTVSYDGSGDSGEVYDMQVSGKVVSDVVINDNSEIDMEKFKKVGVEFCKKKIMDCVEHISMTLVDEKEGGWENNEGARGDVIWNIKDKKIIISHQERVMEYSDRDYTIEL